MEETRRLRNLVMRCSFVLAAAIELISLFFTGGFNAGFAYGLVLGTAVGVINFSLLTFTMDKALLKSGKKVTGLSLLGFVIRMALFGGAFFLAYRLGLLAGVACMIGFLTMRISIYYIHFVKKSIFRGE